MNELNEPQRRAVMHAGGPLLVFAGAGSGKTRVITTRIANLLSEHRVKPFRILAVTFTNKAAGEMRHRLERLVGPEVRDLWVGTFHSICAKLLRRYHREVGLEQSFVIYDDTDQRSLLTRVIRGLDLDERIYPPKALLGRIHRQKQAGFAASDLQASTGFDQASLEIYQGYERALRTANAVDFEDLILHVMRIAENRESLAGQELRDRFDHVLVDEFQDTNRIQYRLVRALSARTRNLCVVGDDDQSIYSWRGADVGNIRGFRRDFPEAEIIKLEQNYRSSGNIVSAALGIIAPSPSREPKQLWTGNDAGDRIVIRAARDERDEAANLAQRIKMEVRAGISPDEIAVFYRINAQSRVLEESLRSERIGYQVIGGMKFFERAEVKDLLAYLRLVDNPRSDADLLRIINVPARGIGSTTIERLLEIAFSRGTSAYDAIDAALEGSALGAAAKKKLLQFRELIEGLRVEAAESTPHWLAKEILERSGYVAALKKDDTAESDARIENLEEALGSIQEYQADAEQAGDAPTLAGYLERVSLVSDIDAMKDEPMVKLMTVHSAKGLEFSCVFLTGMEEETFPYRGLDGSHDDELEEERRLAYVAVTRARKRLYVSYANARTIFGSTKYLVPSRFLAEIPSEVTQIENPDPWAAGRLRFGVSDSHHYQAPESSGYPARKPPRAPRESDSRIDYEAFDDVAHEQNEPRAGDKVFHQRYGRGTVEKIERDGELKIVARFPGFGSRKVLANYLRFG
jgi:DNA helicase-2/ATP-dependent DNA helicase PcrA